MQLSSYRFVPLVSSLSYLVCLIIFLFDAIVIIFVLFDVFDYQSGLFVFLLSCLTCLSTVLCHWYLHR